MTIFGSKIYSSRRLSRTFQCRRRQPVGIDSKRAFAAGCILSTPTGCLTLLPLIARIHIAAAGATGNSEWLTSLPGAAIGALGIAIAWRQRVIQRRDHEAERREEDARRQEHTANEAKIAKREGWRPEYIGIRNLLDRAQKLYFSVRDHGPHTLAEFGKLDVETLRLDCETLARLSMESLHDALLQLKNKIEVLVQNAIPEGNSLTRDDVRVAALQERAAQELDAQIAMVWQVLREEWGR